MTEEKTEITSQEETPATETPAEGGEATPEGEGMPQEGSDTPTEDAGNEGGDESSAM